MSTDALRVLTVRQPWAWAIIHGGKWATATSEADGRIGTCPVDEFQDTRSAERLASAGGRPTSTRSEESAQHTQSTSPRRAACTSCPAATADESAPRARCLARSRASARRARPRALAHGQRRTRTSGSAIAAGRGSSRSTASRPRSTTSAWLRRAVSARSADSLRPILAGIGCMSTTATTRAVCAASCAGRATRASVASATASSGYAPRSVTWSRSAALIGGASCAS